MALVEYLGIDRPRAAADTGIMSKRGVRLKASQGPVYPAGTKATKSTTGSTNAVTTITAVVGGTWANSKVKYEVIVSGANTALGVTTNFDLNGVLTVTLTSATNGGSTATTTAIVGAAAINANPVASQYVTATYGGTGATVVVALPSAVLASGANTGTATESLWARAHSTASVVVDTTDGLTQRLIRRHHDRLISLGAPA